VTLGFFLLAACGDSAAPEDMKPTQSEGSPAAAAPHGESDGGSGGHDGADATASSSESSGAGSGGAASGHDAGASASTTLDAGAAPGMTKPMDMPPPTPSEYEMAKALVGSYAVLIKFRETLTVGVAGSGSLMTTIYATAEIKDDAAAKTAKIDLSLCDERIGSQTKHLMDLDVTVPPAALKMAHAEPVALRVSKVDGKSSWKADELRAVAGWKPASATDELPKADNDPRLLDQDGDGKPGVTAAYTGHGDGSLYLALLYRLLFAGTVGANGELTGTTMSNSAEALLGSTELLLLGATIERAPEQDTADNTVRMIKQSSTITCDKLASVKDVLFL
jgi:hypothetical protein